ncbi:hypothetical protein SZ55_1385 [Pseudomonas sp. FeS53a]|nr:hypothetical protein SZ55_1385 [Pseudomonas sp. FeS53a]
MLLEQLVDASVEFVGGQAPVAQFAHVHLQLVLQGGGAVGLELHAGGRVAQHAAVLLGGLQQQLAHQFQVGATVDVVDQHDAGDGVGQRPVDQLAGEEGLVGDDHFLAVAVGDVGGADADPVHGAGDGADGHQVADAHGALEQQDEAGDEVGEDRLHAEADAHGEGGHQPLQLVPADPEGGQRADEAEPGDGVGEQRGGGVGAALGELHAREHQHFQQARQVACEHDGDAGDDQRAEHVQQADGHLGGGVAGAGAVLVEGDLVEVGEHGDEVGPDQVHAGDEAAQQRQTDQPQGLLVDLFDVQHRLFHRDFLAFGVLLGLRLALGQGAGVGQAAGGHGQAADEGGFDQQGEDQQVEGVDQPVGELERGVVVAETHGDHEGQGQQGEGDADQQAEGRGLLAHRFGQQQVAQHQGHQGVAGEHDDDADDVVGQGLGLVLGDGHHGHQGHDHHAEAADLLAQQRHLGARPAEVQLGDAARGEDAVQGVEHQPGQGHLQQGGAEGGVLATGVDVQGQAAEGEEQGHRQRQQHVEQQRQGRVHLAVALVVADVVVQVVELAVQPAAPPEQGADQQQQGDEQPGAVHQAFPEFGDAFAPGQFGELGLQVLRGALEPGQVQRFVAGDPEHLLFEGVAQGLGGGGELLLVELQGDGFVEQGIELAAQAVEQFDPGGGQVQQGFAQVRGDLFRRLAG